MHAFWRTRSDACFLYRTQFYKYAFYRGHVHRMRKLSRGPAITCILCLEDTTPDVSFPLRTNIGAKQALTYFSLFLSRSDTPGAANSLSLPLSPSLFLSLPPLSLRRWSLSPFGPFSLFLSDAALSLSLSGSLCLFFLPSWGQSQSYNRREVGQILKKETRDKLAIDLG